MYPASAKALEYDIKLLKNTESECRSWWYGWRQKYEIQPISWIERKNVQAVNGG